MRIAALDDKADQIETIRQAMEEIGHECRGFLDESALFDTLGAQDHDLLVLDLKLPHVEGLRTVARIRTEFGTALPILVVTRSKEEQTMVDALGAGADDFMAKPLKAVELQARVRALLRRTYANVFPTVLNFGPYRFFLSTRTLRLRGKTIDLTFREYELALYLFKNLDRLLSREHLKEAVWGNELEGPTRSLDTHMSRVRTKLQLRPSNGVLLSAIYRMGYRLEFIDSDAFAPMPPSVGESAATSSTNPERIS